MYRPIGWNNTYRDDNMVGCACRGAYEAGADAMLKLLREKENSVVIRDYPEYYNSIPVNGTWVFIPDAL